MANLIENPHGVAVRIVTENGAEVVDGRVSSEHDCCWNVFIENSDISLLANDSMNLPDETLQVERGSAKTNVEEKYCFCAKLLPADLSITKPALELRP